MKFLTVGSLLALILVTMMPGASQSSDGPAIINLMIDAQNLTSENQPFEAEKSLEDITNLIMEKNLSATIFSTQDILNTEVDLDITRLGLEPNFELAMSGNNSNEKISTYSYADQKASLERSKKWVEAAKICGQNDVIIYGFKPQSFDQNVDTFKALDELEIQYDAGFQTGLIYEHGHEQDVWPYPVEGYKFYAVPVSTYEISGEMMVLHDSSFKDSGLDGNDWYEAMATKLDQIQGKDEPLVISLTIPVSGSGDYLDALKKFMDYAINRNATFITTIQLVEMAKTGERDISKLTAINASKGCVNCSESDVKINATVTNTTAEFCTTCDSNKNPEVTVSVSNPEHETG